MLLAVVANKSLRPSRRRDLVPELMQRLGSSQRNAPRIVAISLLTYRYESRGRDVTALSMRIKQITDHSDIYNDGRTLKSASGTVSNEMFV
jgi:hypothetical protein